MATRHSAPKTPLERIEYEFEDLIEDALQDAARVKCEPGVYRTELKGWIEAIQIAIQASVESSRNAGGDDNDDLG